MRLLTEKDYLVLTKVFNRKQQVGFSMAKGSSIEDIKDRIDANEGSSISYSKIRDALIALIEYGYVDLGIKKVRKNTYFITAEGMNNLMSINIKSVNIIKESAKNE